MSLCDVVKLIIENFFVKGVDTFSICYILAPIKHNGGNKHEHRKD